MRPEIKGIEYRDKEELSAYKMNAPEGQWHGKLDDHAWGKSKNLLLYFTDITSGKKYRLSVFSRSQYKPYQEGPNFREEHLGGTYEILTAKSKSGLPKLLKAQRLQ